MSWFINSSCFTTWFITSCLLPASLPAPCLPAPSLPALSLAARSLPAPSLPALCLLYACSLVTALYLLSSGFALGEDCAELRRWRDDGGAKEGSSSFPNLKYAMPKYNNVESLLNYVEKGEEQGGLKRVIMNFND